MLHDVFISHASEDKQDFVEPLVEALSEHHIDVWYDRFKLEVGDSLRQKIEEGLSQSLFGIVVLSHSFFQKGWPEKELSCLIARDVHENRRIVLPIWHNIERDDVFRYFPLLADVYAIKSNQGMKSVTNDLLKKLRPEVSPLIVARSMLIEMGVHPPLITDEWWLDVMEAKAARQLPDSLMGNFHWAFPFPFGCNVRGRERGVNIAWTVLQTDWSNDGEDQEICQLTHPERVHEFLRKWPGLFQCARANPGVLATYVPQLTIHGYDDGLSDVFDELLDFKQENKYALPGYRNGKTINGESPLCGDFIAWRHPTYGNYTDKELAESFVRTESSVNHVTYSRHLFSSFECLVWLLTNDANWMPQDLRGKLINGMRKEYFWFENMEEEARSLSIDLSIPYFRKPRITKEKKAQMLVVFASVLQKLRINENPSIAFDRFIDQDFLYSNYEEKKRLYEMRRGKR